MFLKRVNAYTLINWFSWSVKLKPSRLVFFDISWIFNTMELKRLTVFIINHLYFTLLLSRFVIELIRKYIYGWLTLDGEASPAMRFINRIYKWSQSVTNLISVLFLPRTIRWDKMWWSIKMHVNLAQLNYWKFSFSP